MLSIAEIQTVFPAPEEYSKRFFFGKDPRSEELSADLKDALASNQLHNFVILHAADLPSLAPKGFVAIIGFYLAFAVDHVHSDVAQRLFLHLCGVSNNEYWRQRCSLLSPGQASILMKYIADFPLAEPGGDTKGLSESALRHWRALAKNNT